MLRIFNPYRQAQTVILEARSKGRVLVMFSGGRDSLATLLVTLETLGGAEAVFMDSGMCLPGILEYVEKICGQYDVRLHVSHPVRDYQGDLAYQVRRWGYFPSINRNWCRIRLKIRPCRAHLRKKFGYVPLYKLVGIRRSESSRRRKLYKQQIFSLPDEEHSGSFFVKPILNWTDLDVKRYLKAEGVEPNPAYEKYGVADCKWCPYYQPSIYRRINSLHPGIYDDIIELEQEIGKPSVTGHLWLKDVLST